MITTVEALEQLPNVESSVAFAAPSSLRKWELVLVLLVAFAVPMLNSLFVFSGYPYPKVVDTYRLFLGITNEVLGLAVLIYVLFRQGRSIQEIGFGFQWRDLPRSIGILISV